MAKKKPAEEIPEPQTHADYTVLARRYRPQQFSDLVGQEQEQHRVLRSFR